MKTENATARHLRCLPEGFTQIPVTELPGSSEGVELAYRRTFPDGGSNTVIVYTRNSDGVCVLNESENGARWAIGYPSFKQAANALKVCDNE